MNILPVINSSSSSNSSGGCGGDGGGCNGGVSGDDRLGGCGYSTPISLI